MYSYNCQLYLSHLPSKNPVSAPVIAWIYHYCFLHNSCCHWDSFIDDICDLHFGNSRLHNFGQESKFSTKITYLHLLRYLFNTCKLFKHNPLRCIYTATIMKTDLGYVNVWECRDVASGGSVAGCSQRSYVNGFDLPMNFMCPANQYVAGVESYHDNGREDCRWRFISCAISNRITASCLQTGYVNDWDIWWTNKFPSQPGWGDYWCSYHRNDKE